MIGAEVLEGLLVGADVGDDHLELAGDVDEGLVLPKLRPAAR
jgi:hypothetical protein